MQAYLQFGGQLLLILPTDSFRTVPHREGSQSDQQAGEWEEYDCTTDVKQTVYDRDTDRIRSGLQKAKRSHGIDSVEDDHKYNRTDQVKV